MPPRIPILQCLRAQNVAAPTSRPFTTSLPAKSANSTIANRRKYRDPYAVAQAKARKAANISRQEVLKKERAAVLGDPVRGVTTPYLESFDTGIPLESKATPSQPPNSLTSGASERGDKDERLNFFLTTSELSTGISHSEWLTTPEPRNSTPTESDRAASDLSGRTIEDTTAERAAQQQQDAANAREALSRIASLSLGSSKDRLRINKRRCISDFGRHNTDSTLSPRNPSATTAVQAATGGLLEKTPRVGPDTGSSEVQIAILTAKIRTLADFLEGRGRPDKVNKRNLRLLVHRRQKLLRYLERKERGGPRFRNVVEALGLTEGTWKGEISL